ELTTADRDLKSELATLDTAVMATEARLTAMGGDDLGDSLAQFESLFEKARGLSSLLAERRRGIDRDRGAFVDQGVIATLEAESARLQSELTETQAEAALLEPQALELAEAERELAAERDRFELEWADGVAAPSGRASEVRGELAALRQGAERGEGEMARMRARLDVLTDKSARLAEDAERLRLDIAAAATSGLPPAQTP